MIDLQKQLGLTYMFISHDLSVVKHISDNVVVMYLGQVIEKAPKRDLFKTPMHPYTIALLSAIPSINVREKRLIFQRAVPNFLRPVARRKVFRSQLSILRGDGKAFRLCKRASLCKAAALAGVNGRRKFSSLETETNVVRDQLKKAGFDVTLSIQPDYGSLFTQVDARNYDIYMDRPAPAS